MNKLALCLLLFVGSFTGCACNIAAERVGKEIPVQDGFVRLAPELSKEELIQIIYKDRYTFYTLDHVLNDGPDPASLDLAPTEGWAIAPVNSN